MADKWQAQQILWESFDLPAYDEKTVPDDAVMPYITYEAVAGNMGAVTTTAVNLWYRSNSWAEISRKAQQIATYIDNMVSSVKVDGGRMKVRLPDGMAWGTRMEEPSDGGVRRIRLAFEIEFLTSN